MLLTGYWILEDVLYVHYVVAFSFFVGQVKISMTLAALHQHYHHLALVQGSLQTQVFIIPLIYSQQSLHIT